MNELPTIDTLTDEDVIAAFQGNDKEIVVYILAKINALTLNMDVLIPEDSLVNTDEEVLKYSFYLRREIYYYFLEAIHVRINGGQIYLPGNIYVRSEDDLLSHAYGKRLYYEYILRKISEIPTDVTPVPTGIGTMIIGETFIIAQS